MKHLMFNGIFIHVPISSYFLNYFKFQDDKNSNQYNGTTVRNTNEPFYIERIVVQITAVNYV